jgi:hypothetical protein
MSHKPQYTPPVHEHIEEWHHHTAAEGLPQAEHGAKPNMLLLLVAFVGSVGFVGLTILATYMYFNSYTQGLRNERAETTAMGQDYRDYRAKSKKDLEGGYVWLNDEAARAGRVTLPITTAKERVIARYQK